MGNLIFRWQNMCLALVGVLMFCLHKQKEKQNMLKYHTERELERRRKICRKKGYDALEVSRHIINYSNDAGYGITSLKLQKLLYFVQAYFLIKKGKPCFRDDIEAWDFGPVVPSVYREYKRYGGFYVFSVKTYIEPLTLKRKKFEDNVIFVEDKKLIDSVVDAFADCSNSWLTDLVHSQTPWQEAYRSDHGRVISANAMKNFFA